MSEKEFSKSITPYVSEGELSKTDNILNKKQMEILLQNTPKSHVFERPAKGGGKWKYVTGVYMKKVLNLLFGWDWDFEVIEHRFDLSVRQAYVLGKLTVRTNGKTITKMQFGRVDIKFKTNWENGKKIQTDEPLDIGNDLKAATTDALKKCASELGIAADIYGKEEFKEIHIVGDSPEEMVEAIKELMDTDGLRITEDDRINIERIIDQKEVKSYEKVLKMLNRKLPKK